MVKIKNKTINSYSIPYVIAEIGANHNGDMDLARQMIDDAKACGCDAVKFQSWSPDSLVSKEEYDRNQKYNDSQKKHFGSLREMIEKYYLRPEQHKELKEYCDNIEIEFCSTPFSKEEVDLLEEIDVSFYKIASMDINNLLLLEYIARKNKPVILSTGMSTLAEIETAVKTVENVGNKQIVLLHCIAIYPPAYEDINLKNIPMLKQAFPYPVGFSDHTIGTSIPLAAVALGACIIEKHFTIDKHLPGWDHEISADPEEMATIIKESKNISKALGIDQRVVSRAEEEKKLKFRRSAVASKNLKQGHVLVAEDIIFKRPGTGIKPDEVQYLIGRKLAHDISADELIQWNDLL
ncbi:MAG: N-acetylneuraminate synthase family protein [Deltaproteobacteria bacterium]|nr:N-acetylneuraminate synthase family protein [Deltaproteobacteria bacterium]